MTTRIPNISKNRYQFAGQLEGHKDAINSVAISPSGKFLVSGGKSDRPDWISISVLMPSLGTDGVKVWGLDTRKQLAVPNQDLTTRGPVTCIIWMTRQNDAYDTLCFSTGLGHIVFWQRCPLQVTFSTLETKYILKSVDSSCNLRNFAVRELYWEASWLAWHATTPILQNFTLQSVARTGLSRSGNWIPKDHYI